jgi:hypothetical protein
MGLFGYIKSWLTMPLTPNADTLNLTIYVGILFCIAWLWASVIGGISRIEGEVIE